jgi:segregation and condensation protein B
MSERERDTGGETVEQQAVPQAEAAPGAEIDAAASEEEGEAAEPGRERLDAILESVLFAAGEPLPLKRIAELLNGPSTKEIKASLARLAAEYAGPERGIHLVAVAGGFQFRTAPQNAEWVRSLLRERPSRLGRAALETLAVIAYKQPATRAEVEAIRGVDADSTIGGLLAKRLIKIAGRKEAVGRPLLYATTPEFLEVFGLKDLSDLPVLKEIGPAPEGDDEASIDDEPEEWRAAPEDPERSGDQLASQGGGDDPPGAGEAERPGGDGAGDEGDPGPRPDHD